MVTVQDTSENQISSLPYTSGPNIFLAFIVSQDLSLNYRVLAFCADLIFCIYVLSSDLTTGKLVENYVLGLGIAMHIFIAVHFLLLVKPLDDFRHERDTLSAKQMPFWQRVYWSLCSILGYRAVGWNVQVCICLYNLSTKKLRLLGSKCSSTTKRTTMVIRI